MTAAGRAAWTASRRPCRRTEEDGRLVQDAIGALARCAGGACVADRRARHRRPGEPPRRDTCRDPGPPVAGKRRADAARHDLPHRLHDQAGDGGCGDDPGRAVQAAPGRSRRRTAARARQPARAEKPRKPDRRHRAGTAADHAARSAHLHLRPGRGDGVAGQASHPEGDAGRRRGAQSQSAQRFGRRVHEAGGQPAAGLSARRTLALSHRLRRAGRADRARLGPVAERLHAGSPVRAARHARHRLPGAGRQGRAAGQQLHDRPEGPHEAHLLRRRPRQPLEQAAGLRSGRRRPGLDGRRLSRLPAHALEQGAASRRAHPVASGRRRADDDRPAHAGAESKAPSCSSATARAGAWAAL